MKRRRLWGAVIYGGLILLLPAALWLLLTLAQARSDTPAFVGAGSYLRLLMADGAFLRAAWNTLALPAAFCVAVGAGFVVLKRLALDRWQSRLREPVCYAGLTVVLFGLLVFRLPVMLGLPANAYSAQGVVTAPSVLAYALDPSYLLLGGVMLECSLIVSLLAWLADRFLPRRAAKQEQAPGT